eukprot:1028884-Pelagomonas_calceolata.AAC.4
MEPMGWAGSKSGRDCCWGGCCWKAGGPKALSSPKGCSKGLAGLGIGGVGPKPGLGKEACARGQRRAKVGKAVAKSELEQVHKGLGGWESMRGRKQAQAVFQQKSDTVSLSSCTRACACEHAEEGISRLPALQIRAAALERDRVQQEMRQHGMAGRGFQWVTLLTSTSYPTSRHLEGARSSRPTRMTVYRPRPGTPPPSAWHQRSLNLQALSSRMQQLLPLQLMLHCMHFAFLSHRTKQRGTRQCGRTQE